MLKGDMALDHGTPDIGKERLAAGVSVAYGQGVIRDDFIPVFGTGAPLQVGFLLAFAAQLACRHRHVPTHGDRPRRPAHAAARLRPRGGRPPRSAESVHEAYRTQPARRAVVHDGRVVAERGNVT